MIPAEVLEAHRPYGLDCKCGEPINSDGFWVSHVRDVLREALTVRSVEELDALPVGTVIRDSLPGDPVVCERQKTFGDSRFESDSEWFAVGDGVAAADVWLPALVLFRPDWNTP